MLRFDWDPAKAKRNLRKHSVSFDEALTRIFDDAAHAAAEVREIIVGHSTQSRLLFVSFTARDNKIRLISARVATATERRDYEENQ
jgi:uncharacterized DUF497 family protein